MERRGEEERGEEGTLMAELEPGHGSPGHRVTGSVILSGSGRVSGQSYLLTDPVL